jgi:hypothetical protein
VGFVGVADINAFLAAVAVTIAAVASSTLLSRCCATQRAQIAREEQRAVAAIAGRCALKSLKACRYFVPYQPAAYS